MTLLSTAKEANFGSSAIICPTSNPAIARGTKIHFINSEKIILGVNNFCTNIRVYSDLLGLGLGLVLVLGLGLGLASGSSLVGVCRHLAAVVSVTYTTVMSIVDFWLWSIHDGRVCSLQARRSCP